MPSAMLAIRLTCGAQDERAEHHQAGDDHICSSPEKECLVDGEPADLTGLDVGSEVGSVEAEEVDIGEHEQRRRPQG